MVQLSEEYLKDQRNNRMINCVDKLLVPITIFMQWQKDVDYRKDWKTRLSYACEYNLNLNKNNTDYLQGYCFGISHVPFRLVGFCDEVRKSIRHTGWYLDNDQITGTCRGIVYRLPARKGKNQFIAGHYQNDNDEVVLNLSKVFDDEYEVARYADQLAERYAEESREYYAKDQAEQETIMLHEEIAECRIKIQKLIKEFKQITKAFDVNCTTYPVLKDAINSKLKDLLRQRTKAFKRIVALHDNFWLSVEGKY